MGRKNSYRKRLLDLDVPLMCYTCAEYCLGLGLLIQSHASCQAETHSLLMTWQNGHVLDQNPLWSKPPNTLKLKGWTSSTLHRIITRPLFHPCNESSLTDRGQPFNINSHIKFHATLICWIVGCREAALGILPNIADLQMYLQRDLN